MDFHTYVHAVGTGNKSNRDLTFEESTDMMRQVLAQSVFPEQIAAFLTGWRLKPETTTEFRGALAACDEVCTTQKVDDSLELGYPFDGKVNNPYLFPLVARQLKRSGLNLVVAGDDLAPAKRGITLKQICSRIAPPENLRYFDRKAYCPAMHRLTDIRMRIGLRTGLNTLEKLPRIAQSDYAITGVFHKPFVKKYVAVFAHRYKRLALIQGNEGTPELFSKGRLWIAHGDAVQEYLVDPARFGIRYDKSWERITPEESLAQIEAPSESLMKLARLNAAVLLFVSERADSIETAYERLG